MSNAHARSRSYAASRPAFFCLRLSTCFVFLPALFSLSPLRACATTQLGPDALLQDVMIQHNLAKNESHTFKVMRPSAVPVI